MDAKKWYASKTLWMNGLAVIGIVLQGVTGKEVLPLEVQSVLLGVINVALRLVTKQAVVWMLAAVMLTGSLVTGCAGSKANKAVTAIEIANASINNLAAAMESACQDGRVPPDVCNRAQAVYDRVKLADDAVIHAMTAAIEAGEDPQSSPDYNAAMAELTKAMGDLYALAGETGVISTSATGGK